MASSVTAASFSQSRCNCVSPRRCLSPASVTSVLLRLQDQFKSRSVSRGVQSRVTYRGVALMPTRRSCAQAPEMHQPRVGDAGANVLQ